MEYDYQTELTDYLPIFLETFKERLKEDKKKWGNTWKHRSIKGQDERLRQELNAYWDQYDYGNQDLPYLKMIGNIFINWVREYEKEIYEKETETSCKKDEIMQA